MSALDKEQKNRNAQGLWWKRFLYTVTGANLDYEVGPNWFASVMGDWHCSQCGQPLCRCSQATSRDLPWLSGVWPR